MEKDEALLGQFGRAVKRLDEVLRKEKDEFIRDSAIKRFEFTFDLSWTALKAVLKERMGIVCTSPKDCLREAYKQGLIKYDDAWLAMVDLRNETAHTYKEEMAEKVYAKLQPALNLFQELLQNLKLPPKNR